MGDTNHTGEAKQSTIDDSAVQQVGAHSDSLCITDDERPSTRGGGVENLTVIVLSLRSGPSEDGRRDADLPCPPRRSQIPEI